MGSTWSYLDITALGRQEEWEDSPEGYPQTPPYEWWIWHDDYSHEPREAPRLGRSEKGRPDQPRWTSGDRTVAHQVASGRKGAAARPVASVSNR